MPSVARVDDSRFCSTSRASAAMRASRAAGSSPLAGGAFMRLRKPRLGRRPQLERRCRDAVRPLDRFAERDLARLDVGADARKLVGGQRDGVARGGELAHGEIA